MNRKRLGKGLESLIPQKAPVSPSKPVVATDPRTLPLSKIQPNAEQPRKIFKEDALKELVHSIRSQGVIQPLVVKPLSQNGTYELIAGERRFRASQLAGLKEVPVIIKSVSRQSQLQMALIENIQREDLNPIEEAHAFKHLMEEFHLTQETVAEKVGKSRESIANTLRLLTLPTALQEAVMQGSISAGHARNLVSVGDEQNQKELMQKIIKDHLTVRDVEKLVADWKKEKHTPSQPIQKKDPEIQNLENQLQQTLGTKVQIKSKGKGKNIRGSINISYFSLDDLEAILKKLRLE